MNFSGAIYAAIKCVLCHVIGATTCIDKVMVEQRGNNRFGSPRQVIVPCANFTCSGRITGITASLIRIYDDGTDPYFELWRPTTPDLDAFNKVGEVQFVESEIVQFGHDPNDDITYWVVNISLSNDERIEFEAGDVIGYYHPTRSRYNVWSVTTAGYRGYANNFTTPSSTIYLSTQDFTGSNIQPLIQFTIGKNNIRMLLMYICIYLYVTVEIQCDILSTPSNGGMSCSAGRVGVGYEGDTCNFTCNTGYELTGSDTRTCQSNGSWSGSAMTCLESMKLFCVYIVVLCNFYIGVNISSSSVYSNMVNSGSILTSLTSAMVYFSSTPVSTFTAVAPSVILMTSDTVIKSSTVLSSAIGMIASSSAVMPAASDNSRTKNTDGGDDSNVTPIIVGPVLAVVCGLIVVSSVCVCVFFYLRKQSKQKKYSVKAGKQ